MVEKIVQRILKWEHLLHHVFCFRQTPACNTLNCTCTHLNCCCWWWWMPWMVVYSWIGWLVVVTNTGLCGCSRKMKRINQSTYDIILIKTSWLKMITNNPYKWFSFFFLNKFSIKLHTILSLLHVYHTIIQIIHSIHRHVYGYLCIYLSSCSVHVFQMKKFFKWKKYEEGKRLL